MNPKHQPPVDHQPQTTPGSRSAGPDDLTLGGLPPATIEARRAKRASSQPDRDDHPVAQSIVGRSGCEEMARWILAHPEARAPRRSALRDVLALDAPTPDNVTDLEILELARSCGDGTSTDADARATCVVALGIGPPVPRMRALIHGATREEIVAQARAWCVVKIHERAELERRAANPDPEDPPRATGAARVTRSASGPRGRTAPAPCAGPARATTSATRAPPAMPPASASPQPDRNRARKAREIAGLSVRQAAGMLGVDGETIVDIEANDVLYPDAPVAAMANLYRVSPEWLRGEVPEHDYALIDSMTGADKLTPRDRDTVAQFAASLPRNGKTAADRIAEARNAPPPGMAMPRIFTPRDDGACAVCGSTESDHRRTRELRNGSAVDGAVICPAVTP